MIMTQADMQSTISNMKKLTESNFNTVSVIINALLNTQENETLSLSEALKMTHENMDEHDAVFRELAK